MSNAEDQGSTLTIEGASSPRKAGALDGQIFKGSDLSAFEGYTEAEAVGEDSLAALQSLAQELLAAERNVRDSQAAVIRAVEQLADVQEHKLPDLMQKHNLKRFDFVDNYTGTKRVIEFVEKWRVAMPPKSGKTADPDWRTKHPRIFSWLESIGKGAVIKKELEASLGLMSDSDVLTVVDRFKEANPNITVGVNKFVEPATLTALVSHMKDDGKNVSEDLIVKPVREARVKSATAKGK